MNTGVHGWSAALASWRLRVTRPAGRTSLATSHSHSPSRRDASSSRLRPGHGGSGASCGVRTSAPAAAHAAGDRAATSNLDELLAARGEQGAELERWLSTVTPDDLSAPAPVPAGRGWPPYANRDQCS